jgi:peptide/nickel transport system ATP-binding protein
VLAAPTHPYTRTLLAAVPLPQVGSVRSRIMLQGEIPSLVHPPSGCRFHTRCPEVHERCCHEPPALRSLADDPAAACHLL